MTYDKLIDKIFESGKDKYDDMECFIESSRDLELNVHDGEVSSHTVSRTEGLSFRGLIGEAMGYSYTEKVDETSIDMLIDEAEENAKCLDTKDKEIIFEGSKDYIEFKKEKDNLLGVSTDEKVRFLKKMEKAALDFSDNISSVAYCVYEESSDSTYIKNTKGLDLEHSDTIGSAYISVVAKEGNDIQTGNAIKIGRNFSEFDYEELANEASREAISKLGSESIESDNYNTVIYNKTFSSLLGAFLSVFSADNVQDGMSLMKDMIDKKIGSSKFTLKEDPHMANGFNSRSFDDEGVATKPKDIVLDGVLKTYLYNLKTALKDKVDSTGNGFRNSFKSGSRISYTNLIVEPGEKDFGQLLKTLDNGLFITELQGLHSGLNAVSGDFSLSANGYEIKEGKIYRPVNQITIAGNLVDLFKNIEEIGNDFEMASNRIGSPSILIKDLAVSGK